MDKNRFKNAVLSICPDAIVIPVGNHFAIKSDTFKPFGLYASGDTEHSACQWACVILKINV